jgi:hypothetical protein
VIYRLTCPVRAVHREDIPMDPALDRYLRIIWYVVAISAGVAVVVMAVLRLAEDFFPFRRWWQEAKLRELVRAQASKVVHPTAGEARGATSNRLAQALPVNPDAALTDLVRLATGGHAPALYDLPIDRLAGQLSAAAQAVLDSPDRHKDLVLILATGSEADDLELVLSPPPLAPSMVGDAQIASVEERRSAVGYIDARNRVTHQIQRNPDALQIHMTFRLRAYLEAMGLGLGLVGALVLAWSFGIHIDAVGPAVWVIIGLLGGFLGTLLTDAARAIRGRGEAR